MGRKRISLKGTKKDDPEWVRETALLFSFLRSQEKYSCI
jgi:hypothetical protein